MAFSVERNKITNQEDMLGEISALAGLLVRSEGYRNNEGLISDQAWGLLVEQGLLSSVLLERDPKRRQEEIMKTTRVLSYHDLHLGLTYGIVAALGVIPLQRFSNTEEQREEWLDIVRGGERIGLAITELNKSGSAAMEMDSYYEIQEDVDGGQTVSLDFSKHLQGLSGHGGLIVALLKKGASRKTVGLFFVPQELIETQETKMLGLDGIRYGINKGLITLNLKKHLLTELPRERLDEFQDIFTKSRMLFVAMTLGHMEKMEMEAIRHTEERLIEGKQQNEIPAVVGVLNRIRAHREIAEAIFDHVAGYKLDDGKSLLDGDTTSLVMEANIVKTLSTEYAAEAASWRAELVGGAAYYKGGALQDYVDIWPFLIFEGSRLFLNNQIARSFLAPSKVDGKIVVTGFSNPEHSDFMDYFFKAIRQREMFNGVKIDAYLSDWTRLILGNVTYEKIGNQFRGVVGEMVSRLFALGCLDEDETEAIKLLNLEIAQLAQNFLQ